MGLQSRQICSSVAEGHHTVHIAAEAGSTVAVDMLVDNIVLEPNSNRVRQPPTSKWDKT